MELIHTRNELSHHTLIITIRRLINGTIKCTTAMQQYMIFEKTSLLVIYWTPGDLRELELELELEYEY